MKKLNESQRKLALDVLRILDGENANDSIDILNAVKRMVMLAAFLDIDHAKEVFSDDDDED